MASVWKRDRSRFWYACFTDGDSRQQKKSTKCTDRKKALRIADELEQAHRQRMTAEQIFKLYSATRRDVAGEEIPSATVRDYFGRYLAGRKNELSAATLTAYAATAQKFLDWLGADADAELHRITKKRVAAFRDALADALNPASVNNHLRNLRVLFRAAKADDVADVVATEGVKMLKKGRSKRRGFTLEELRVVMREVKGTEWESLVRFGLYTGQRLGDLARLRWSNIDLEAGEMRLATSKSGGETVVIVPLCKPLAEHILTLEADDSPDAFVHPRAAALGVNHLSREFGDILGRCGFRKANANHVKIEGREGVRRETNPLSFHSLRHSAVSMMKNAGISAAVVQDLVGHESEAVSRLYTHFDHETKRTALEKLPLL